MYRNSTLLDESIAVTVYHACMYLRYSRSRMVRISLKNTHKKREKNVFLVRVMFILLSSTCRTPIPRECADAVVSVHVSTHHALSYRARRRHNHASPVRLYTSHTATAGSAEGGPTLALRRERSIGHPNHLAWRPHTPGGPMAARVYRHAALWWPRRCPDCMRRPN